MNFQNYDDWKLSNQEDEMGPGELSRRDFDDDSADSFGDIENYPEDETTSPEIYRRMPDGAKDDQ